MKFLIIDQYYPDFLKSFYLNAENGVGGKSSYEMAKKDLMLSFFGTSDFYSGALNKLGHKAEEVVANNVVLQKIWAEEYLGNLCLPYKDRLFDQITQSSKYFRDRLMTKWEERVLYEQIRKIQPDIVYVQNIGFVPGKLLRSVRPKVKLIVGQIASPVPPLLDYKAYDLIITSFPHFVDFFKKKGVSSEYLKLAFEPSVLDSVGPNKRVYDVTFVGGLSRVDKSSNLYKYHHGEVWGKEMYEIFTKSKISINRHIDVAKNYANNMRLYEATGCGALLITDKKDNLSDLFEVGKEIEDYKNVEDLAKKIDYYLKHPRKREGIAKTGQKKTLTDRNYLKRMA